MMWLSLIGALSGVPRHQFMYAYRPYQFVRCCSRAGSSSPLCIMLPALLSLAYIAAGRQPQASWVAPRSKWASLPT